MLAIASGSKADLEILVLWALVVASQDADSSINGHASSPATPQLGPTTNGLAGKNILAGVHCAT